MALAPTVLARAKFEACLKVNPTIGTNGSSTDAEQPFTTVDRLKAYWTKERIREALGDDTFSDYSYIRDQYIRVFSVLVLIGSCNFIEDFLECDNLTDQQLPFQPHDPPLHNWPPGPDFGLFYKKQWQFCVQDFKRQQLMSARGAHFEKDRILPFHIIRCLRDGGSAKTCHIRVSKECNHLVDKRYPTGTVADAQNYVLKTYYTEDAEKYYYNEVSVFRRLMRIRDEKHLKNIVIFYGSWRQGNTYNILLEYANQGNLEEYWRSTPPPMNRNDILQFWSRLFQTVEALQRIHEFRQPGCEPLILQGIHQDIKPANILVTSGASHSKYDVIFKIADLGLSHFKAKVHAGETIGAKDTFGTPMYSAPECCRWGALQQSDIIVTPYIDIWSLGCVFSQAAVWVVLGEHGREDYAELRTNEIAETYPNLAAAGYADCFHNGTDMLAAVYRMHRRVSNERRITDSMIDHVITLIEHMLETRPASRYNAEQLLKNTQRIIDKARDRDYPHVFQKINGPVVEEPTSSQASENHSDYSVRMSSLRTPPATQTVPSLLKVSVPTEGSLSFTESSLNHSLNGSSIRDGTAPENPASFSESGQLFLGQEVVNTNEDIVALNKEVLSIPFADAYDNVTDAVVIVDEASTHASTAEHSYKIESSTMDSSRVSSSTKPTSIADDTNGGEEQRAHAATAEVGLEHAQDNERRRPQVRHDDDIKSLISLEDYDEPSGMDPETNLYERREEVENAIVYILATDVTLAPLYGKAFQLMTKERFVNNYRRLLKVFRNGLKSLPKAVVTQELAAFLSSRDTRQRIAEKIVVRSEISADTFDEARATDKPQDVEMTGLAYTERWLKQVNLNFLASPTIETPPPDHSQRSLVDHDRVQTGDGFAYDSASESSEASLFESEVPEIPTLDHVVRVILKCEPFQDFVVRLKEFLLPHGLIADILYVPRENITFEPHKSSALIVNVQGWLEAITSSEWDWWPLSPRLRSLRENETRVYWRCFCGTLRWRELDFVQREILEDVLAQSPPNYRQPPLCASFVRPGTACGIHSVSHPELGSGPGAPVSRMPSAQTRYTPASSSSPTSGSGDQGSQSGRISNSTQPSGGAAPSICTQPSTQSSSQLLRYLWLFFGVDGPRITLELGQIGNEHLLSDRMLLKKLKRRHSKLRGWFRSYLSFWRLSYWEFVKFEKICARSGRMVVREVSLPNSNDYEYCPKPPNATIENPGITKHEFKVIVRACIKPCWLAPYPWLHDCIHYEENATAILVRIPKRDHPFQLTAGDTSDKFVWGIQAKYAISALRVIVIHLIILAVSVGLWVWWQQNHPNDLQGGSVPITVGCVLISTFWASTGILKGLR